MTDLRYNNVIEIGVDGNAVQPIVILCTRSEKKLGVIYNIQNFRSSHPLADTAEVSFDVYKVLNGRVNPIWDSIKNFKFIYLPTVKDSRFQWYEITVNIDEDDKTIKHITGVHANEAELGQLMLYDVEINTEDDINRDDYEIITIGDKEYGTVFYNPEHPKASLLHRVLSDKASHYQIIHVDETLKNIQREFSFNGVSIVDALKQNIAQEIGCLFVFGKAFNNNDGSYHRTISVYDLMDYCEDCGERGSYTQGVCPHCGSTNIQSGFGKDTGIFINSENLAETISLSSHTDQVKNFFKLSGGDDDMTAAIRNCNPNGSDYLCFFSDEMKEDMSDELVARLNEYNIAYDAYLTTESITLPSDDVTAYNALVNKYQDLTEETLEEIPASIIGFNELTKFDYNSANFRDILETTMMVGSSEIIETDAQEQLDKLTVNSMSPIGVEDSSAMSLTAADTAVKSYAKVYVDTSRYNIELSETAYENNTWTGTITITSLTDETDTANKTLTLLFNNDGATFTKQKIEKLMKEHEVEDIGDVSFLQRDISDPEDYEDFLEQLGKYSLDALGLLDDLCVAVMDILAQAGYGDENSYYYEIFYYPYWVKRNAIMAEETERENEIAVIDKIIEDIADKRQEIVDYLSLESFFGETLYAELMLYRRETEYSNPNFISDGLSDSEIINNAQEFFKRAKEEILKASTIQHSITTTLYNLFLIPEFRDLFRADEFGIDYEHLNDYYGDFLAVENGIITQITPSVIESLDPSLLYVSLKRLVDFFDSGNWLRIQIDDKVYKLRLTNWEIDYSSPENLEVEFSDVVYCGDTMSDIASLLSQARTMASSYDAIQRQAGKGQEANNSIEQVQKQGLILSQSPIINNIDEQTIVINSQGTLLRGKNDFDDGYSNEQVKLLNKGIYYTNDSWETVKAGLGHFMYYDPDTKTTKEDYGIIASTIVGQLLLGENLKIYSDSGSLKMDEEGFAITAQDGENNSNIFVVQKDNGDGTVTKYLYVNSEGELQINGNSIVIGNTNVADAIDDAEKVATNFISIDNSGLMVADLTEGTIAPSEIQTGKNVLITDNEVKIREGTTELASYGQTTRIGKEQGNNIQVTDNTFSGNKYLHTSSNPSQSKSVEVFNVTVGETATAQLSNIVYKPEGANYVSCDVTLDENVGDYVVLHMNGIVVLENGQYIGSGEYTRIYDKNAPQNEEIIEGEIIEITWRDRDSGQRQTISGSIGGPEFSPISSFSVNDSECTTKIDYVQLVVSYETSDVLYPHYRFGVHDAYEETDKDYVEGKFSFDIGENNNSLGGYSFTQGMNNTAQGLGAFVTGNESVGSGKYSVAMGEECIASGDYSQSYGYQNQSSGRASYTSGIGNISKYEGQTIIGKYAPKGTTNDLFMVGNGTDASNRSYAMRLRNDGRAEFSGAVGSGLNWVSRTEMINKMKELNLNRSYSFFASYTEGSDSTIYWSATATAGLPNPVSANAFGSICKLSSTHWHMFFMCAGNLYKSVFVWDGTGTLSGTFTTTLIG